MVQLAEAFLRHKNRQPPGNLHHRLQALRSLLASRLHLARLIPPADVRSRRKRT